MAKAPPATPVPGPAFIRLLARLTDADIRPSSHALADRLSEWIDWTRAVALSKALDGRLPEAPIDGPGFFDDSAEGECARVRHTLVDAITGDLQTVASKWRGAAPASSDYSFFRERYLDLQRTMQVATGRLRGRLRDLLTHGSPDKARLAEVDAVMELTLSPREHTLLDAVPVLLEHHFQRLREAGQDVLADPQTSAGGSDATPGAWLDVFRQDMRDVLLAELDVRFHPIEGLLAALRPR